MVEKTGSNIRFDFGHRTQIAAYFAGTFLESHDIFRKDDRFLIGRGRKMLSL